MSGVRETRKVGSGRLWAQKGEGSGSERSRRRPQHSQTVLSQGDAPHCWGDTAGRGGLPAALTGTGLGALREHMTVAKASGRAPQSRGTGGEI